MPVPPSASWTIRKIFSLRRMVQPWIGSIIGDGQDTFLWLDNWHPLGLLKYRFEVEWMITWLGVFSLKLLQLLGMALGFGLEGGIGWLMR